VGAALQIPPSVRRLALVLTVGALVAGAPRPHLAAENGKRASFTVEQILSLPTPDNLVAAPVGSRIAWTFNERGVRNIYIADGPGFTPKRVTRYADDDGQELTNLVFSRDARTIIYVRGGDHGSSRSGDAPNPSASPNQPKMQVLAVSTDGDSPIVLGEGDDPVLAPDGKRVAFVKDRRIWIAPVDGSAKPEAAFFVRGAAESPTWSPDGGTLAFVVNRGDHSFIGLFSAGHPLRYIAPSTSRDSSPTWSADGRRLAFVRQPGTGGAPRSPLVQITPPWKVLVADVNPRDPDGVLTATPVVTSGDSPVDPILQNPGGIGLRWAADDTLLFLSYRDGWPHLYSLRAGKNSRPLLLTPGSAMVEQVTLTPDRRFAIYNTNAGATAGDVERRHLFKVPVNPGNNAHDVNDVNAASPMPLTTGTGIEWSPVVTADGRTVAFLSADAQRPPLPAITSSNGGNLQRIASDHVPADFPAAQLVAPEPVTFRASDGVQAYGQLFKPANVAGRRPAIVYIHGGGPRQMLLGWHYRWEYANDYGANQYLASQGFVVLSVNYRLSVGYGQAFQFPERAGARGASEYLDVLAAGHYLQSRGDVDAARIGVWGASYGGYLTALALGRNSEVFAAGVDIHGVHDRLPVVTPAQLAHALVGDGITEADLRQALKVEFEASPIAAAATWKSPVLLIHGDDDRTVDFHQTIDLERRLTERGVNVEELVLPDDVHDSLLWRNWRRSIAAMGEFFERRLKAP
jgi:dipeptidyl aminopeptidase/acylaminoacyl peptidase